MVRKPAYALHSLRQMPCVFETLNPLDIDFIMHKSVTISTQKCDNCNCFLTTVLVTTVSQLQTSSFLQSETLNLVGSPPVSLSETDVHLLSQSLNRSTTVRTRTEENLSAWLHRLLNVMFYSISDIFYVHLPFRCK